MIWQYFHFTDEKTWLTTNGLSKKKKRAKTSLTIKVINGALLALSLQKLMGFQCKLITFAVFMQLKNRYKYHFF